MDSYILSQFTRLGALLEILNLAINNSLSYVFPMWSLTTFDRNPDILRGPTMQFQPSPGKLLTGFQLFSTEKDRIFFDTASHLQLAIYMGVSWYQLTSSYLCTEVSSHMMKILLFFESESPIFRITLHKSALDFYIGWDLLLSCTLLIYEA